PGPRGNRTDDDATRTPGISSNGHVVCRRGQADDDAAHLRGEFPQPLALVSSCRLRVRRESLTLAHLISSCRLVAWSRPRSKRSSTTQRETGPTTRHLQSAPRRSSWTPRATSSSVTRTTR